MYFENFLEQKVFLEAEIGYRTVFSKEVLLEPQGSLGTFKCVV